MHYSPRLVRVVGPPPSVIASPAYNTPVKYLRVILIVLLLVCCTLWVASYWKIAWVSSDSLLVLFIRNGIFAFEIFEHEQRLPHGLTSYGYDGLHTDWWPVVWVYPNSDWWILQGTFWLPTLLLTLSVAISVSYRPRPPPVWQ